MQNNKEQHQKRLKVAIEASESEIGKLHSQLQSLEEGVRRLRSILYSVETEVAVENLGNVG